MTEFEWPWLLVTNLGRSFERILERRDLRRGVLRAGPLERYALMDSIVVGSYKFRKDDPLLRDLCECMGWKCLEFIEQNSDNSHWQVFFPQALPKLVTVLTERGAFEDAIDICEKAIKWGLQDGTKSGYEGRIHRTKARAAKVRGSDGFGNFDLSQCDEIIGRVRAKCARIEEDHLQSSKNQEVPILELASRKEIREFERRWVHAWEEAGEALDVKGETGYIFRYVDRKVLTQPTEKRLKILKDLRNAYSHEQSVQYLLDRLIYGIYMIKGDYENALKYYPSRHTVHMGEIFSLKMLLGESLRGIEVLEWFGQAGLTGFGVENLDDVVAKLDEIIDDDLLIQWAGQCERFPFSVLTVLTPTGASNDFMELDVPLYAFALKRDGFSEEMRSLKREAENLVRDDRGIPRIGEGWVSETQLYCEIEDAFGEYVVLHHASPQWLGSQHLDIFLPEFDIALEYQGLQHEEPVDFFGGEEAFRRRKELDERKRQLCEENKVKLVYVYPGYDIEEVINKIRLLAPGLG